MSTTTNTTITKKSTRPATFTKSQWDKATYDCYMALVTLVKGEITLKQFTNKAAGLFTACGVPCDSQHIVSLLIAMTKDTTKDHEKIRKVNSITGLRQFFNGAWEAKDSLQVVYNAGKAPTEKAKKANKAKKPVTENAVTQWFGQMSAAEKTAFINKLMAA